MHFEKYANKIIKGDSAIVLSKFPDNCIDLVVTSPPYDALRTYNNYVFDFESIAKQLFRVVKNGGVVVWVVADSHIGGTESGSSFRQALFFMNCGFKLHDTMIFAKKNPWATISNSYKQQFEYMFILCKGKLKTFIPLLKINIHAGKIMNRKQRLQDGTSEFRSQNDRKIKNYSVGNNIWYYGVTSSGLASKHPAVFPIKLAEDHIISWSNEGDIVLDPFFGSGTTGAAAKRLGRKYIGIEISEEYCKLARERIDADKVQYSKEEIVQRLFSAEEMEEVNEE